MRIADVGWGTNPPTAGGFRRVVRGGAQTPLNVKELLVPLFFLPSNPIPEGKGSLLRDGQKWSGSTVPPAKGLPDPPLLFSLSGQIFGLAARFHPLSATRFPGPGGGERGGPTHCLASPGSSVEGSFTRALAALCGGGASGGGPLCSRRLPNYRPS
ncbi:hypothetical protein GWK47_002415 [Chionoecetes opilio]|uniref:Uncharacterized protein n=1 Tax=Chionoecetes opilio TaxID=41210 RepID=A0A8J4XXD1_CHIOP|nr:hypothetical protein GWK47_002415 [Chionoecetes opilio]